MDAGQDVASHVMMNLDVKGIALVEGEESENLLLLEQRESAPLIIAVIIIYGIKEGVDDMPVRGYYLLVNDQAQLAERIIVVGADVECFNVGAGCFHGWHTETEHRVAVPSLSIRVSVFIVMGIGVACHHHSYAST